MTAVTFDTLKLARRLENAGFTRAQADGAAEALAESLSTEIATKGDLAELRIATKSDLAELRTAIAALDRKLSAEIASARSATAQWIITGNCSPPPLQSSTSWNKTFSPAKSRIFVPAPRSKSLLVLFFRKEQESSFSEEKEAKRLLFPTSRSSIRDLAG